MRVLLALDPDETRQFTERQQARSTRELRLYRTARRCRGNINENSYKTFVIVFHFREIKFKWDSV